MAKEDLRVVDPNEPEVAPPTEVEATPVPPEPGQPDPMRKLVIGVSRQGIQILHDELASQFELAKVLEVVLQSLMGPPRK